MDDAIKFCNLVKLILINLILLVFVFMLLTILRNQNELYQLLVLFVARSH